MISSIAVGLALSLNILLGLNPRFIEKQQALEAKKEPEYIEVWLTAYSSTPDQTDSTPHITASNTKVRHGIVAANFLPLGTEIQIPEVFGDKVLVVEDRMHRRKTDFVDVWMPTRQDAKNFGIRRAKIIIVERGLDKT
ncbi:MAG: hypothetical protein AAB527_01470 [Patescibacteria group bacterium]